MQMYVGILNFWSDSWVGAKWIGLSVGTNYFGFEHGHVNMVNV